MSDRSSMLEQLILPENYTDEVRRAVDEIKLTMGNFAIEFSDDTIKVVQYGDSIYVLGNPILGEEPIFDELGNFQEMVPLYNITLLIPKPFISFGSEHNKIKYRIPRVRIIQPEFCKRIKLESAST